MINMFVSHTKFLSLISNQISMKNFDFLCMQKRVIKIETFHAF